MIDLIKQWQEEGRNEGIQQERLAVAQNLLANDVDIHLIANATGLSLEQLQNLQSKMKESK